jgi:hypothetical protein
VPSKAILDDGLSQIPMHFAAANHERRELLIKNGAGRIRIRAEGEGRQFGMMSKFL